MDSDAALQAVIDKQAIRDLIYTYCRSVDRLDVPLGHSVFHPDSHADYGEDYYQGPGRGVIDTICQHHLHLLSHSHQVSNILIELSGNSAGSEAYVHGTMRLEQEGKLMQLGVWARYLDAWEKREGRWGIVRREAIFDLEEIRPVTPMGRIIRSTRDTNDPSYAFLAGQK